jgi:hypothetical protein
MTKRQKRLAVLGVAFVVLALMITPYAVRLGSSLSSRHALSSWNDARGYFANACNLLRSNPTAAWYRFRSFSCNPSVVHGKQSGITVTISPGRDFIEILAPDSRRPRIWGQIDKRHDGLNAIGIRNVRIAEDAVFWETRSGDSFQWKAKTGIALTSDKPIQSLHDTDASCK